MAGKRVLFFGVTGVDKKGALGRLADWVERYKARPRPRIIDFERDFLFNPEGGGKEWYSFLDDAQHSQRAIWRSLWKRFLESLQEEKDRDLFVSMHGCIVRGHYGVRCVIDPWSVADELRPNLVVTLLDDIYDMWWRTEERAGGTEVYGRPSIEQLLFARRAELIVADQVAYAPEIPIPQFVVSVAHPCETLANRIYSRNPTVVYLCFPISAPRDLKDQGDTSGEEEVLDFLKQGYERQHRNPDLALVCPLGIDELPLVKALHGCEREIDAPKDGEDPPGVEFDRDGARWPMDSVWGLEDCLSEGPPRAEDRKRIPALQVEAAAGMILTDVGWRDYRLVEQSKTGCLVAFNPKFKNREIVSRSVYEEILFATTNCPVFICQDARHDPDGIARGLFPEGGTMPHGPGSHAVKFVSSVQNGFDEVEQLARRRLR